MKKMNQELAADTTLSHYRIVSKIGAGGMGEVYLAEDTRLRRKVALKVLPTQIAQDTDLLRRFEQEALAASALNHPNILTIYEFGAEGEARFIAAEFIDGETLRARLERAPLPLNEALDIGVQTAQALSAAHEAHIIHRDIKPENVMIRRDGIVKVLDFGLAKLTERPIAPAHDFEAPTAVQPNTAPGTIMGTASYMSPEQARGQEVDARTDIFSLGIMLYEMLTGRPPFEGVNALDVISAILQKEPAPLTARLAEAPRELEHLLSKSMRKNREQRYQTGKDLLIDLKDIKEELAFAAKQAHAGPAGEGIGTTRGIIPTKQVTTVPTSTSAKIVFGEIKRHKLGVTVTLFMLAVVAALSYWALFASRQSEPIESIAVMPFVNESGDAEVEYLSDGMTETLIRSLSQLPNLNVKARSSVFRYKGKEFDLPKIARELKVQAILTGRVVQRGEQLTLSLELVDAETENALWSEQYNRRQADLITLQSEIARDVSGKLKTRLSGADEAKVTKNYTANPAAYQLYLKGRFYWNRRTTDALKQAAGFYNQAIEKDPNYALAYSGLAETYVLFPAYSVASADESMPRAKAAATRALELDDSLAEAHSALGRYLNYYEWDRIGAEKEFRRAIELNPNYATVHDWLGAENLALRKRFDEALVSQRRAEELDPLSLSISANVSWTLFFARRYDEAIAQLNRTLALDPNFYVARSNLCWAYGAKGMYREAIAECRKARELNDDSFIAGYLALVLARSGQREEARKLLDELKLESPGRYVTSYGVALAHIGLNEKEEAFAWLEKEVAERGYWAGVYAVAPELDGLRSDPRFKQMLKRLNLPE